MYFKNLLRKLTNSNKKEHYSLNKWENFELKATFVLYIL